MNPIFVFLVIIGAVLLWFLLAFSFRAIGGIADEMINDVKQAIQEERKENTDGEE